MSKKKVTIKSKLKPTRSSMSDNLDDLSMVSKSSDILGDKDEMLFGKTNYMYILGGIGLMVLGFILMSGGSMPSPDVWDDSIIYSTRRTLIAPILILAGLVLQLFAIFKK